MEIKAGKVRTTEIRALKTREKGRWNKADMFSGCFKCSDVEVSVVHLVL